MQGQIQIFSQIMNYMTKSSCQKLPFCRMFAYVSESAMYSLSLCNEHYKCFKTSKHDHEFKHKCVGKYDIFFKCFEKSEDELTWCFHDRDHKNDASLGRLLWLFSLITHCYCCHRDAVALENHYLVNIFNRPVCLSFLPSGHNYNSQLTLRKRA